MRGIPQASLAVEIDPDTQSQLVESAVTLLIAVVVWVVVRTAIRRWIKRLEDRTVRSGDLHDRARAQRLATLARTASMLASVAVVVITALVLMGIWGIPIGPIIAAGSVVGIAVGFGAQNFIKDVIAGVMVLVEDQYSVGDVVMIGGVTGTVEDIRMRTTVLRDLDGSVHHVPHGGVNVSTNFTYEYSRLVIDLDVSYDGPVDHALSVVEDEIESFSEDPEWAPSLVEEQELLGVDRLDDAGVGLRVLLTTVPADRWKVRREFLRRIKNRFDVEGIEFAHES